MKYKLELTYNDTDENAFEDARVMSVHLNALKYQMCLWGIREDLLRKIRESDNAEETKVLEDVVERINYAVEDYGINLDVP